MKDDALDGAVRDMKASLEAHQRAAERTRKLHASQLEKLASEHEAEKAALEAALVAKFTRALKFAAKRRLLNTEVSPLKATMVDSLTVSRTIGKNASSGEDLEYKGLSDGLALHLVEAAWTQGAEEEIESLIERAAEIMSFDDSYLASAEKDLAKQASVLPQLSIEIEEPLDSPRAKAAAKREELLNGNPTLTATPADVAAEPKDARKALRSLLASGTRLGRTVIQNYDA
jgi:hypothetical protein